MGAAKLPELFARRVAPLQFVLLAILLCLSLFLGGSSWPYEWSLGYLRAAALLFAAIGIWSMRACHFRDFFWVWLIFEAIALLIVAHLIPLPFEWWSSLPGRQVIVDVDAAAGLGRIYRPLSMSPEATLNALYSLSVPLAVLVLAVQLDGVWQRRLLALVLALVTLAGLCGLLQASGVSISLYFQQSDAAGFFANRNHQGALLAALFPMCAAVYAAGLGFNVPRRLEVITAAAIATIAVPLVVVTGSRSGLFVSGVAIAAIPLLRLDRPLASNIPGRTWPLGVRYGAAALTVAAMVGATVFAARDVAISRLNTADGDLRWPLWQSVIDAIPHYLPWGTGVGSFAEAYKVLEPDSLLRVTYSNHAHSDWLEVALTGGIPGILILAACAALVGAATVRGLRSEGEGAIFARLGAAMIAILGLASLTDYPIRTPAMSALIALAAVWASAAGGFVAPRSEPHSGRS